MINVVSVNEPAALTVELTAAAAAADLLPTVQSGTIKKFQVFVMITASNIGVSSKIASVNMNY